MGPATAKHLEIGAFQTSFPASISSTTPNQLQQTFQKKILRIIANRLLPYIAEDMIFKKKKKSQEHSAGFLKKKMIYLAKSSFPCAITRLRTWKPGKDPNPSTVQRVVTTAAPL